MFGAFGGSKSSSPSQASGPSIGAEAPAKRGHVIVIGNEKGGSGKTTTTMHLIVALLRNGFTIGSIDIDSRQRSLTRYIENRHNMMTREGVPLPMPQHVVVTRSPYNIQEEAEADERERFGRAINTLMAANDFVVIDSPGSDTYLSRFAHSFADTIITPINDSFVDLDVLATVDGNTLKIVRPSIYSEMVWEQKLLRAKRDGGSIEWIVMRNRLSNIDARNKRFMGQVLSELSRRIGFRAAPGFSERVIFREMFLQGLTVLDVMDNGTNTSISLSHIAARQEVRDLLKTLRIPAIDERVANQRAQEEQAGATENADLPPRAPRASASSGRAAPPVAQPIGAAAPSASFAPPAPPPAAAMADMPTPASVPATTESTHPAPEAAHPGALMRQAAQVLSGTLPSFSASSTIPSAPDWRGPRIAEPETIEDAAGEKTMEEAS